MLSKLVRAVADELGSVDRRWLVARLLTAPMPSGAAGRLRATVLRSLGFAVGPRTVLASAFTLIGGRRASGNLTIGADCYLNDACVFDATAPITIGDRVSLGHGVLITTSSHRVGAPDRRAGLLEPRAVDIGDGAWLASRAVILPGVVVGPGAVVCAGAVVTRSVPPHTMVGGVPARTIRDLGDEAHGLGSARGSSSIARSSAVSGGAE